jgi:hypothetical protein
MDVSDKLDKTNSHPEKENDMTKLLPYLNGLLLFLAGFAVAKLDILRFLRKKSTPIHPYHDKIKSAKDEKALLRLLLSLDKKHFKPTIIKLEEAIYTDKKIDLKALKERLLKL